MCVCLWAHMYLYLPIYLCVCVYVCVYMCIYIYGEEDRCPVVKEKPLVTYPPGHIRSFTQLFLDWHCFEMASSFCDTPRCVCFLVSKVGFSAHLQDTPVQFLENGLLVLVYIC